ncbi:glutathione S-transferase 1-1-like [Cephus cinctus]|uniref:Glutathione S-transferase 1-1-like n=1 Tax=Cephus cinctus TaxID=211228 RepID=A0AAJ7C513_CEPCN|nr:glutathione S-transferase 1-1-like [Cephus cinctus]XP_024944077.1 glutathione S-transferase 1-1-like [Cephus cinctus]
MTIDLYYVPTSPPVRIVRLVAAAVGIPLNLKLVNLKAGEQLEPEFLKKNIQHAVPTIDDNGFYLSESRAIAIYLVDKYAKNDELYPKDPEARALVNQRLFFDATTLYQRFIDYYFPVIFAGASFDPAALVKIDEAFGWLDSFLEGQEYLAGNNLTIADLALVAGVSTYDSFDYDLSKYENVVRWYSHLKKTAPQYDQANGNGVEELRANSAVLLRK